MPEIEAVLRELGLSEKEVGVYLSLLRLGQATANQVAERTKLNRVTTYDILRALIEKGMAGYVVKGGVKYFEPAGPNTILEGLRERERRLERVMPQLEAMRATLREKPRIEQFEGKGGIKTVMNDMLKEGKEMWFYGDPTILKALKYYFPQFVMRKRKLGLFARVINLDCKVMRAYKRRTPKKHAHIRFLPIRFDVHTIIYGNKVAILTFEGENSIGIIIDNRAISDSQRKVFEALWEQAIE